jgi:hypothetical protein
MRRDEHNRQEQLDEGQMTLNGFGRPRLRYHQSSLGFERDPPASSSLLDPEKVRDGLSRLAQAFKLSFQ